MKKLFAALLLILCANFVCAQDSLKNFYKADLECSNFSGRDLTGANFEKAELIRYDGLVYTEHYACAVRHLAVSCDISAGS